MANLTLFHEGHRETCLLNFLANGQRDNFIELYITMTTTTDKMESEEENYELSHDYHDVVMLRDFLTSAIDLYDQKKSKKKKKKKGDK